MKNKVKPTILKRKITKGGIDEMQLFADTVYWGILISVCSYITCNYLQKKIQIFLLNPLLCSTIFTILFLQFFKVDYNTYYEKTDFISALLTPATVSLSIPLYEQVNILKNHLKAVIGGIIAGVISSMGSILFFSVLFNFSHTMYVTFLPKSVTAAIAMGISDEIGGISNLTVPIVIMTGIIGHIVAEIICKIFKITNPNAKGVAIGSSSHAMGTAKAIEMGEIEGAMSSLSIGVAGVITVTLASLFACFY